MKVKLSSKALDEEDEWSMYDVPDERNYSLTKETSSSKDKGSMLRLLIGSQRSPNIKDRIELMYEKRRRSLDKIDLIKHKEIEKLKEVCTFKPEITNYSRKHNIKPLFNSAVLLVALIS